MARAGRTHLRVRARKRTACGVLIADGIRRTFDPGKVTCDRCQRSFFMADHEASNYFQEQP